MKRIGSLLLPAALAACASSGSTVRSGVGDRQLDHPPYYAGREVATLQPSPAILALRVEFQRGASQSEIFDPASGAGSGIAALLADINALVDSVLDGRTSAVVSRSGIVPPNVYFGCELEAMNDCVERGDSVLGRRGTTMKLAVERPSPQWIARAAELLDSADATHALLLTLEVGQYWPRQSGWRGDKSAELGTDYTVELPWLTSLETPITVLQLTGALIDREGRAVRIGAEGILAVRTPLAASGFGLQRILFPEDVQRARTLRHDGRLAWRSATCALVAQLAVRRCD